MNVFGIGLPEMAVIAAVGLLVFGPRRLPELGRTLGRTLKGFQSASSEFEKEFRSAISAVETTAEPSSPQASEGPPASLSCEAEANAVSAAAPRPGAAEAGPSAGVAVPLSDRSTSS